MSHEVLMLVAGVGALLAVGYAAGVLLTLARQA